MKNARRRRRAPLDPVQAEIAELRARAAQVGIRFAGEILTARLPQARCTPEERERAQEMADAAGISLSEHIRRRVVVGGPPALVAE